MAMSYGSLLTQVIPMNFCANTPVAETDVSASADTAIHLGVGERLQQIPPALICIYLTLAARGFLFQTLPPTLVALAFVTGLAAIGFWILGARKRLEPNQMHRSGFVMGSLIL